MGGDNKSGGNSRDRCSESDCRNGESHEATSGR